MKQRTRPTITRTTISKVKYTFTKENPSFLNTLVNENNITKQRLNSNKNAKILQINTSMRTTRIHKQRNTEISRLLQKMPSYETNNKQTHKQRNIKAWVYEYTRTVGNDQWHVNSEENCQCDFQPFHFLQTICISNSYITTIEDCVGPTKQCNSLNNHDN